MLPPARRRASIAEIKAETIVEAPTELPCLKYSSRREVLRYLGYRHITGIKEWDSLSKAKYLDQLRTEFYADLDEENQLKSLAKDIGSRSDYVGKLLTALSLYVRAENKRFFDLPLESKDIEFSYITTALGYRKIQNWLGLKSPTDIAMQDLVDENLKRAFSWMFVKDQQGKTILGESRKLDEMAAIVASDDAIAVLVETGRLSEAFLYTDGPQASLEKALDVATKHVRVVWNMLPKINPITTNHQTLSEGLFEDIKPIRNVIREKLEN